MALAIEHQGIETGLGEKLSGVARNVMTRYAQSRVYRTTLSELSALSNRDLADLGIHRSTIKSVALKAAYGN
jgi:uncharacterized protein YjiS (DUF1127 family)